MQIPSKEQRPICQPVVPYLALKDANAAIAFYRAAFGAVEKARLLDDDGRVTHAEIEINGASIMLSDEFPEIGVLSPLSIGGSPVMIILDVPDVDALFFRAVHAGAAVVRTLQDGFDGDLRTAKLADPFGHRWMILTHKR